jgi:endonuclease G
MKKLLLSIFICIPFFLFAQKPLRERVSVYSPIFHVIYNEKFQQPMLIEYIVTCTDGKASRAGMDFYKVDSVITSDAADYANNVYDKGHMAPAADFNCSPITLKQTFSYLNCALQDQYLNRGPWKLLEEQERVLVKQFGPIEVTIVLEFTEPLKVLPTGATIPTAFRKLIYIPKTQQSIEYYFKNEKPSTTDYTKYRTH